jgi:hypothetical protein
MYTVWHVDKHKITFKLVTNQSRKASRGAVHSIIDARAHYWAAARRLSSPGIEESTRVEARILSRV